MHSVEIIARNKLEETTYGQAPKNPLLANHQACASCTRWSVQTADYIMHIVARIMASHALA